MSNGTPARRDEPALTTEIEKALVQGDIGRLTPEQRWSYYEARCKAAGLNPVTRPFEYLQLSGRLVLYATKSCTDGLSAANGLTHRILSRETVGDIHEVLVEVSSPAGRSTQDVGCVVVGTLKGEALCNARMKAVTKAKRRAVLGFCGLGDVIDESELDTVRDARRVIDPEPTAHHAINHDNGSGHGSGAYADPGTVKAFAAWCKGFADEINAKWLDKHTSRGGEIPDGLPDEVLSTWQLSGHLLKWGRAAGLIVAPEEIRSNRDKYTALLWQRHLEAVNTEAVAYARKCWKDAAEKLAAREAAKKPEAVASGPTPDAGDDDELSGAWAEGRE